ncbi:MAG: hypothetical protein IJT54_08270 [Candidatus Methanomethylophilaceae archaeon]|nr:hypothetical protein [Candidatus Methanomethylophilaceae archaeon]
MLLFVPVGCAEASSQYDGVVGSSIEYDTGLGARDVISVSGLPPGTVYELDTGKITGVPMAAGTFVVNITYVGGTASRTLRIDESSISCSIIKSIDGRDVLLTARVFVNGQASIIPVHFVWKVTDNMGNDVTSTVMNGGTYRQTLGPGAYAATLSVSNTIFGSGYCTSVFEIEDDGAVQSESAEYLWWIPLIACVPVAVIGAIRHNPLVIAISGVLFAIGLSGVIF